MNTAKQRGTFISYSRTDKEFALKLARELKSAGYFVWLDQLDIPTGARWDDAVEKALREYEIFLIILTPASVSSENVKDEIGYAIDHGKRIMPVLLKECDVPLRLRRFQYVDFTKMEFSEGISSAKQLLEALLNEWPTPRVTINPEPERQKVPDREARPVSPIQNKNKVVQRRGVGIGVGLLSFAACLAILGAIFVLRDRIFSPTSTSTPISTPPTILTSTPQATSSPTPPNISTSTPEAATSLTSSVNSQSQDDMPYWVVTWELIFAPEYWSIGTHEYTIDASCPNYPDSNGNWTNTFDVSEDASLLPGKVYLRFAGVKKQPIGIAPSLDKIHPAQATVALFGNIGTHAEDEQLSTDCTVTLSWDGGEKQVMFVGKPYYDGP